MRLFLCLPIILTSFTFETASNNSTSIGTSSKTIESTTTSSIGSSSNPITITTSTWNSTLDSSLSTSTPPSRPPIKCPHGFLNKYAHEGREVNNQCVVPQDCLKIGLANDMRMRLDAFCVFSKDENNNTISGCCYKDTSQYCSHGVSTLPAIKCSSLDDCNLMPGYSTQRWCDPNTKQCCRHEGKEVKLKCPDNITALMNEPECVGSTHKDINSGKCPSKYGTCYHGHCCPPNGEKPHIGSSYETRQTCNNNTKIKSRHRHGYCNPRTGTIWIMGTTNSYGQPNKRQNYFCMTNRDCGKSTGHQDDVCVRWSKYYLRCYFNPEIRYDVPEPLDLTFISTVSYTALASSVIGLLFSLMFHFIGFSTTTSTVSEEEPLVTAEAQE